MKTTFLEEEDSEEDDDDDEEEEEEDDVVYQTPEDEEEMIYDYIKIEDRLKDLPEEEGVARKTDWVCYKVDNIRDPTDTKPEAKALAWCLQSMLEREQSEVEYEADSDFGYNFPGASVQVPPGTKLKTEVQLIDWYDEAIIEDDPSVIKRITNKGRI